MAVDQKLLAWYKKNGRDLPWRKTRDPYKILVSEVMLQQTQVPRVLMYYKKWLKQFPNWVSLSRASNADVIRAWAGLGYNRRALILRDVAREIEGNWKLDVRNWNSDKWLGLKGIGPYTAAALAIFTRAERTMPIDTNIRRVLGRLLLDKPFSTAADDKRIQHRTQHLLKRTDFDLVPQALFDLATTICKKVPDCAACPLRNDCKAARRFLKGSIRIPKAMIKKANETIHRNKKYPDRIYRGRILKLVREANGIGPIGRIGPIIDETFNPQLDQAWLKRMLSRLEKDQLIERKDQQYRLKT